jgi:deoxycytidylate deaminase
MALLDRLMITDQYGYKEIGDHSQQVGKFFKEAHAFLDMDTPTQSIDLQAQRILELLYGNNIQHSPTRDEYAMALARIASYRSAELGRQVGAVISTSEGDILAVAPNEISHYPGKTYFDTMKGHHLKIIEKNLEKKTMVRPS